LRTLSFGAQLPPAKESRGRISLPDLDHPHDPFCFIIINQNNYLYANLADLSAVVSHRPSPNLCVFAVKIGTWSVCRCMQIEIGLVAVVLMVKRHRPVRFPTDKLINKGILGNLDFCRGAFGDDGAFGNEVHVIYYFQ